MKSISQARSLALGETKDLCPYPLRLYVRDFQTLNSEELKGYEENFRISSVLVGHLKLLYELYFKNKS